MGLKETVGETGSGADERLREAPDRLEEAGFWASVRESLRGTERDFTEGSLNRAVGLLAVPMVLEMAGESVFAICDAFFVARLGSPALAAVGRIPARAHLRDCGGSSDGDHGHGRAPDR